MPFEGKSIGNRKSISEDIRFIERKYSTPTTTFNHKYTNNTNRTNSQPIVELRTLILGSHVGPESLTQTQFYILGKRSKDKDQIYKFNNKIRISMRICFEKEYDDEKCKEHDNRKVYESQ